VIDGSAEMLGMNRRRLGAAAVEVNYKVADLFEWRPRRIWDACVFGFWLCQVPDDRMAESLDVVIMSLRRGGVVCFVDKAVASDPVAERVRRTLNDGRCFTIIDHPRSPQRLIDEFAAAGLTVDVETIGSRFCVGHGTRFLSAQTHICRSVRVSVLRCHTGGLHSDAQRRRSLMVTPRPCPLAWRRPECLGMLAVSAKGTLKRTQRESLGEQSGQRARDWRGGQRTLCED
jgi:hypothetical protein